MSAGVSTTETSPGAHDVYVRPISPLDERYVANEPAFATMMSGITLFLDGEGMRRPDGGVDVDVVRARFEAASYRMPALRMRLMRAPLGVISPSWVPADLDLAHHVRMHPHVVADDASSADLFTGRPLGRMDPDRPLWDALVIDLDSGRIAVAFRYHHVVGDGAYGTILLNVLLRSDEEEAAADASGGVADPEAAAAIGARAPRSGAELLASAARRWRAEHPGFAEGWADYRRLPLTGRVRRWGGRVLRPSRARRAARVPLPDRHSSFIAVDAAGAVKAAYRLGGTLTDLTAAVLLHTTFELQPDRESATVYVPFTRRTAVEDGRNLVALVAVTVDRGLSVGELIAAAGRQIREEVAKEATGPAPAPEPGAAIGFVTHLPLGRPLRRFGPAGVAAVACWPTVEVGDDVGLVSLMYGRSLVFSMTTSRTDIDVFRRVVAEALEIVPEAVP